MRYKPCCNRKCMVHGCKTKEQGACYCICRMWDSIHNLESIMEGRTLYDGMGFQYIPSNEFREQVYNSWSDEKKQVFQEFKNFEAPKLIQKMKEKLKEFEINEQP